ncbi:MAG: GNAT family N-acetyltransferase [Caulobacter sp.]|jgi:ribosomal protein S18 acetylase RimI-like enzyme
MALEILRLGPGDDAVLAGADVFDYPVRPDQARAFLADPGHEIVVARQDGRIIGMATGVVLLHPDKQPAFFINEVGVDEDQRRSGVGRQLVEHLLEIARERGCRGIWLATEEDNVAARALYRRTMARETGGIVVYDWDDAMPG